MPLYNKEAGYGRAMVDTFPPVSPSGRQFIVGAVTLANIQIAQQLYRHDPEGNLRMFSTLAAALAGVRTLAPFTAAVAVTASTSADTLTTVAAHGFQNGDKVYLSGTTAPSGTTLGLQYYVVGVSGLTFQISLQRAGTAIDLTTAGTAVKVNFVSSCGDTVYVLPGHAENISSATAYNFNISGVKIIGLGTDEDRPTFYLDTGTTTTITVSAAEVTLSNVIIDGTGFDAIASILTVNAPGFQLRGCKIIMGNSTNQCGLAYTTNAVAHRFVIDNCRFIGSADAGTTNALQLVGGDDGVISNNFFFGNFTTSLGPINNITTACLRLIIRDNILVNNTASSTKLIVLVSGTTGTIIRNRGAILSGTAAVTGAGMYIIDNVYVSAASVGATQTQV